MEAKAVVAEFIRRFFNEHDLTAPLDLVREDYIQHNPGVAQGRQALIDAFAEKFRREPDFHLEILKIIAEGDTVAVYQKNVGADGHTKARVVDIYRVKDNQLAEHWDVLQPV